MIWCITLGSNYPKLKLSDRKWKLHACNNNAVGLGFILMASQTITQFPNEVFKPTSFWRQSMSNKKNDIPEKCWSACVGSSWVIVHTGIQWWYAQFFLMFCQDVAGGEDAVFESKSCIDGYCSLNIKIFWMELTHSENSAFLLFQSF